MGLISNGTTIFDAGSLASGLASSLTFIKKITASSSATVDFVDGSSGVVLDNTYKEYLFTFKNIHPSGNAMFRFQGNAAGGSGFKEAGASDGTLMYNTGGDQAQATGYQNIALDGTNNDADGNLGGYLHLFNPSSTTFRKHYISRMSNANGAGSTTYECDCFSTGYFNTTSAIDEISFKFHTGNIDAGDICLYGIN